MKYNYDKSVLKGLGVGPFLNLVKTRDAQIQKAPSTMPVAESQTNFTARDLHPAIQNAKIVSITEFPGAKAYKLESLDGKRLAFFRAGQYTSVNLQIGPAYLSRAYSICSAPKAATYTLLIKEAGFASDWINENWKVGDTVSFSGPLGEFYYTSLRDAKTVIAIAGGSGITPFYSMASSIVDGTEDFNLTILYGSRNQDAILLKDELKAIEEKSKGKVKVVHVLSEEKAEGFEQGFITAELIKKYAPKADYSIFMCGPKAMYEFEDKELAKLNLPRRRVRRELFGEYGNLERNSEYQKPEKESFSIKVQLNSCTKTVQCKANQTILSAIEEAGIKAPAHCRSGECGWCHSKLVSGKVFIPKEIDGRRLADVKFGWIHPCACYALSDLEIIVKAE